MKFSCKKINLLVCKQLLCHDKSELCSVRKHGCMRCQQIWTFGSWRVLLRLLHLLLLIGFHLLQIVGSYAGTKPKIYDYIKSWHLCKKWIHTLWIDYLEETQSWCKVLDSKVYYYSIRMLFQLWAFLASKRHLFPFCQPFQCDRWFPAPRKSEKPSMPRYLELPLKLWILPLFKADLLKSYCLHVQL